MKNPQALMRSRMAMYAAIRTFFAERQVAEVETPILSPYGSTDVHIDSFVTHWAGEDLYLHTSPEFSMKQLLADGFGDCYQMAKVFRHEPAGKRHRPEFTMLEWYRLGFSLQDLINEVTDLVKLLVPQWRVIGVEQLTYLQAFEKIGVNPYRDDLTVIKTKTEMLSGYLPNLSEKRDEWLDFLLVTQIEGQLGKDKLTFLTHYPASMAALARKSLDPYGNQVAERFELYYQGVELANGFDELTDADEQLARFEADNHERKTLAKPEIPLDADLIAALVRGMPPCSGVAVGLDRLFMLAQGAESLDEVMPFKTPSFS